MCQVWHEELYISYHLILHLYNLPRRSAPLAPFCRHESKGPKRLYDLSKVISLEGGRTESSLTPPTLILSTGVPIGSLE